MQSKHTQKPSSRINIPMCAAAILLCLTLFSAHFTSGLYAKYTATATGSDSARVAKFEVDVSGQDLADITCTQNDTDSSTYTITITNTSEVAVRYELSLKDPAKLPTGVTYAFSPVSDNISVGDHTTCSLVFTVNWAQFTADATGDTDTTSNVMKKEFDFTVNVHIEQID